MRPDSGVWPSKIPQLATMVLLWGISTLLWQSPAKALTPTGGVWAPKKVLGTSRADWVATGDGLVLFGSGNSVHVANIGTPQALLATLDLDAPVAEATVIGRYAYLAQDGLGLRVLDLAVPDHPADLGLVSQPGAHVHIARSADNLLVASDGSLTIMAMGTGFSHGAEQEEEQQTTSVDPLALREVASLRLAGVPNAIGSAGTRAFLATSDGLLYTLDLSENTSPRIIDTLQLPVPATALAANMDGVAIGFSAGGGPYQPSASSPERRVLGEALGLASEGRRMFIASGERGLLLTRDESAQAETATVRIGNFGFSPMTVDINPGDTVHWVWGTSGRAHSTVSGTCVTWQCTHDGIWRSGLKTAGTFDRTFSDPGTFRYHCGVHHVAEPGEVIVSTILPRALEADYDVLYTYGTAPLSIWLYGGASGGTPPYSYSWSFGDGTTSNDQDVLHTFVQVGRYQPVLTVQDAAGATAQVQIQVIRAGTAPVIASITEVESPFRLLVGGSNLQPGIDVGIGSFGEWTHVRSKGSAFLEIAGGASLKAVLPKGEPTSLFFVNPDGGAISVGFTP